MSDDVPRYRLHRGLRTGIVTQTVLLATAVAAIAVLVAGLAAAPFVRAAAETEARASLATLADLTATYVDRWEQSGFSRRILPRPLLEILRQEQVVGFYVGDDLALPPGLSNDDVTELLGGESLSVIREDEDGELILIEGRPTSPVGVVLIQPLTVAGEVSGVFLVRIISALALGLLIAVVIAYFAARRLSRPLRAAREVAHQMAVGERQRTLEPTGPTEVGDIAKALNALNAALLVSEGRQREFLLSVSHELRTPLTAVKGYGEALSEGVLPAQDVPGVGSTIASEAQRLDRLVNDLLDLARLGAVDFHFDLADVDISEVLVEAGQVWRDRCARAGVHFELLGIDEPVIVRADSWRLRQIIDNLAENALRVSPTGSTIAFALHRDPDIAAGPFAVIEVRDAGPGLSEEDLAIAFEPGALHERYRGVRPVGTGLGLALVSRLAAGLHGSATVTSGRAGGPAGGRAGAAASPVSGASDSESGPGASFWVRVPLAETGDR